MLIRVDANPEDISTAASGGSSHVSTDPSVPPTDGTCHFMKLPIELRLTIVEHIFEDLFTRLTLGLYPPFLTIGESRLPYTQELFSVLHVNRAFRLESIELCTILATHSAQEVVRHPPGDIIQQRYQTIRIQPHEQLKSKHKKILKILQKAKVSTGYAQADVAVREDLRRALLTRGRSPALSQAMRRVR
jgi:hypothetical protein